MTFVRNTVELIKAQEDIDDYSPFNSMVFTTRKIIVEKIIPKLHNHINGYTMLSNLYREYVLFSKEQFESEWREVIKLQKEKEILESIREKYGYKHKNEKLYSGFSSNPFFTVEELKEKQQNIKRKQEKKRKQKNKNSNTDDDDDDDDNEFKKLFTTEELESILNEYGIIPLGIMMVTESKNSPSFHALDSIETFIPNCGLSNIMMDKYIDYINYYEDKDIVLYPRGLVNMDFWNHYFKKCYNSLEELIEDVKCEYTNGLIKGKEESGEIELNKILNSGYYELKISKDDKDFFEKLKKSKYFNGNTIYYNIINN